MSYSSSSNVIITIAAFLRTRTPFKFDFFGRQVAG